MGFGCHDGVHDVLELRSEGRLEGECRPELTVLLAGDAVPLESRLVVEAVDILHTILQIGHAHLS